MKKHENTYTIDVKKLMDHPDGALPEKYVTAGNIPLWDLRELKEVVIPEGVTKIGNYWFSQTAVTKVIVPASVREIGTEAFYGCKELEEVLFPKDSQLEIIGARSFQDSEITRIDIPDSVTTVCEHAFQMCKRLGKIKFSSKSKIKRIGKKCFYESGLMIIFLFSTPKHIGSKALRECDQLRAILV